jgi:hypothetical protein
VNLNLLSGVAIDLEKVLGSFSFPGHTPPYLRLSEEQYPAKSAPSQTKALDCCTPSTS